ncbi:MAG: HYR domain-containing protein, partial [Thermomicrobiales bacterium]
RKFTIDRTAPLLNVMLGNGVQASAGPAVIPFGLSLAPRTVAATETKPSSRGPANLDIRYADPLSGVATIEYQLDGSEWKLAFNDAMFSGAMTVAAPGDHLVSLRATDLAGNISPVRTFDFTVLPETGQPATPTPVPTAVPTTVPTTPMPLATTAPTDVPPSPSATPVPTEQPAPDATQTPVPTRPPAPTAAPNAPAPPADTPVPEATAAATAVPTPTLIPTASNAAATLVLPPDKTVDANAPGGATVPFDVSARDTAGNPVPVTCDPQSGSLFPVGTTVVTCTATTSAGLKTQASFRVTVKASQPPTLSPQDNLTVEGNTRGGATVTFNVTAQDAVDGPLPVSCNPSSGSLFKLGTTNVTCTATNSFGLQGTRRFTVTVRDTTPPALALPGDMTVVGNYNTDFLGATPSYAVSATDVVDGQVPVGCSPASGSFFKGGTTTVNCTAHDAVGNVATGSFNVTVTAPAPPPPPPGQLSVSLSSNPLAPNGTLILSNTGGQSLNWAASVTTTGARINVFSLSQQSGTLAPGARTVITLLGSNPTAMAWDGTITVSQDGVVKGTYACHMNAAVIVR